MKPALWLLTAMLLTLPFAPARALSGNTMPLEIQADEALEWLDADKAYIAHGNAMARRGMLTIKADTLRADYRDSAGGASEVWRMTAEGNVVITAPSYKAGADHAVYEIDTETLILTGNNLTFTTTTETVTARDTLEWHDAASTALARGAAKITRPAGTIEADTIEAEFTRKTGEGALILSRLVGMGKLKLVRNTDIVTAKRGVYDALADVAEVVGDVVMITEQDVVRGRNGRFDMRSRTARINGDVRITRGRTQMNGDSAVVDFKTGISRLLAGSGRVRGMLIPSDVSGR
ncbi:MAG: LptA/OstA family protein [Pseudomonadota bacterium]|nr:LptA/OstA family protein [Pseudomonadota bacterium]